VPKDVEVVPDRKCILCSVLFYFNWCVLLVKIWKLVTLLKKIISAYFVNRIKHTNPLRLTRKAILT
jgi:hypothetical protein